MIETNRTDNLQGQLELTDFGLAASRGDAGAPSATPTGYDDAGNLINPARDGLTEAGNVINPGQTLAQTNSEALPEKDAARLAEIAIELRTIDSQETIFRLYGAIERGRRLIEARQRCPKGYWLTWLKRDTEYSERTAQNYMKIFEEFGRGELSKAFESLDFSKAVALLSAPPEAREELAEKAVAEDLSVRQLQEEIRKLKEKAADQQMVIDGLISVRGDRKKLQDERDEMEEALKAAKRNLDAMAQRAIEAEKTAKAAEESLKSMRQVSSKAADDAAASAQQARDAVERANRTAQELSTARARIAELEAKEPEVRTVTELPDSARKELDDLKRALARAEAKAAALEAEKASGGQPAKAEEAGPVEKFKWFYGNQMKPAFSTALNLLKEVAEVDGHAANMFATALVKGCKQLMAQLGVEE